MKMDFQNTEQVPFMQNDQRRVRGSTLFLAELFVQLTRPEVSLTVSMTFHYLIHNYLISYIFVLNLIFNIITVVAFFVLSFRIHAVRLMYLVMS